MLQVANCLSPSAAKNDNESCLRQFEHFRRSPSSSEEGLLLDPSSSWRRRDEDSTRAVPDTADTPILPIVAVTISATIRYRPATYIFAVTIPDKASALPISYRQIVDDIGETGKEYEIKCQNKEDHNDLIVRSQA
ncbi:hypothetical protein V8E54_007994 [Elaphomyces granulatus]